MTSDPNGTRPTGLVPKWQKALQTLEKILSECGPLEKRSSQFVQDSKKRIRRIWSTYWRIAVAGSQGNGKSTLAQALLASPRLPAPPIPVQEREETRIPIVCKTASPQGYVHVTKRSKHFHKGEITEAEVRKRTSADARFFKRHLYSRLEALELHHPLFRLPEHVDLVDLPGVAGNLAGITEWAKKYLLEESAHCIIFVVTSSQSIDCVDEEANLIRAFGPLMVRTIFVQNVWQGYDDDIESTKEANLEFLRRYTDGQSLHYLLLDCASALDSAREGDYSMLEPLLSLVSPFINADPGELVKEQALRLSLKLGVVEEQVERELWTSRGEEQAAEEARRKHAEKMAQVEIIRKKALAILSSECLNIARTLVDNANEELRNLEKGISDYITGDRTPTPKLLEREVARLLGNLNRNIKSTSEKRFQEAVENLKRRIQLKVKDFGSGRPLDLDLEMETPQFNFESRKWLRGLEAIMEKVLAIGIGAIGFAAGAQIGAALGAAGGPVGAVIGVLVGGLLGWLGGKVVKKGIEAGFEKPLAQSQVKEILAKMKPEFKKARNDANKGIEKAVDSFKQLVSERINQICDDMKDERADSTPFPAQSQRQSSENLERELQVIRDVRTRVTEIVEESWS